MLESNEKDECCSSHCKGPSYLNFNENNSLILLLFWANRQQGKDGALPYLLGECMQILIDAPVLVNAKVSTGVYQSKQFLTRNSSGFVFQGDAFHYFV